MVQLKEAETQAQLKEIQTLYVSAFPKEERKPFSMILKMREKGISEILWLEDEDGSFAGLAITLSHRDMTLLDYFAIADAKRGKGIGSAALAQLREHCRGRRFFLEIESTIGCKTKQPIRRKHFYQAAGMQPMNYLVDLFGVEMELMTDNCTITFEEYHGIFEHLFPKKWSDRVRYVRALE